MLIAVYPRVLGERGASPKLPKLCGGLSPCARGTLPPPLSQAVRLRFIPVCSGNAHIIYAKPPVHAVYPRVLGERLTGFRGSLKSVGLSPCARGTLTNSRSIFSDNRFIPVCSGNARGINNSESYLRGLSPCARGTLFDCRRYASKTRFIPVCSGNADRNSMAFVFDTVYPRVLGERLQFERPFARIYGLSPCARGTPCWQWPLIVLYRFIPVCSGNAHHTVISLRYKAVYPRVLGERGIIR